MLKKIIFYLLIILIAGILAQFYQLNHGSIIVLMPQFKISINLIFGIILLLVAFIAFHQCLKIIRFLKLTPKAWKKYRNNKNQNKHNNFIQKALIHFLNCEYTQAEYQFKQAYLIDTKTNHLDLLMAIHSELKTQQTTKAQEEIGELNTSDSHIQDAKTLLQAQIYDQKNQNSSAILTIKSDKQHAKKKALANQLCESYFKNESFPELIDFISQRANLSTEQKKLWTIKGHVGIIRKYQSKNLLTKANNHYNEIPGYLNKEPEILTTHLQTLLWINQVEQAIKLAQQQISTLLAVPNNTPFINFITNIHQKEDQKKLLNQINKYISSEKNYQNNALLSRAHIFTTQKLYEKAIDDYQTLINISTSIETIIGAKEKLYEIEKAIEKEKNGAK